MAANHQLWIVALATVLVGCESTSAAPTPTNAAPATATHATATASASASPSTSTAGHPALGCLSIERADGGRCVPACPHGEVYIPATGPEGFVMGKGFTLNGGAANLRVGHLPDSDSPHRAVLTKPFCMDETEVTVAALEACVKRGACDKPKIDEWWANYPRRPNHPVNEINWAKAKKYCNAVGKDLPTEAQWEWAATGGDGRKWPWGDATPTCEHADFTPGMLESPGGDSGCHGGGTSAVKTHPKGVKHWPDGDLYDMAGNVWEWCDDHYRPYPKSDPKSDGARIDPDVHDPRAFIHVVRGGGWNRPAMGIQTAFRGAAQADYQVPGLGFRCVRNP